MTSSIISRWQRSKGSKKVLGWFHLDRRLKQPTFWELNRVVRIREINLNKNSNTNDLLAHIPDGYYTWKKTVPKFLWQLRSLRKTITLQGQNKSGSMIKAIHYALMQYLEQKLASIWQPHLGHIFPVLAHWTVQSLQFVIVVPQQATFSANLPPTFRSINNVSPQPMPNTSALWWHWSNKSKIYHVMNNVNRVNFFEMLVH